MEPKLAHFLNHALENKIPVVYITLGSEVVWQKWYVETIWEGIKNLNCKFIWSMPTGLELPKSDYIYTDKWLPQIEILSHPAVKAGMHHCGFSSANEFLNAGLPSIVFPHFGDQPFIANRIIEAEAAVSLFWIWRAFAPDGTDDRNHFFPKPIFSPSAVTHALNQVL